MALARFSIIVAMDQANGIARDGGIPWSCKTDMATFKEITTGNGRNAVIMGRKTYDSIPEQFRPLERRHNVIISRKWRQEDHHGTTVCSSLLDALQILGASHKQYERIFVIGGEQIYRKAIEDFMYLCDQIHVTVMKNDFNCDQHFPWDDVKCYLTELQQKKPDLATREFNKYVITPSVRHDEYEYLDALRRILDFGERKTDRTGTGTVSLTSVKMEFDISQRLPILTTKKIKYENIIRELLFFISGKTDTKILEQQGVDIWRGNTSREFLDTLGLDYPEGMTGPMYGYIWRHFGLPYDPNEKNPEGGIDQLQMAIDNIKEEPHSRRHYVTSYDPSQNGKTVLMPCHMNFQFLVSGDGHHLDCVMNQRSGDFFLGVPYNIASYAMLTYMVAHICKLKPRKLVVHVSDAHIYSNHITQCNTQLNRAPKPFPKLTFRRSTKLASIDDFTSDSFIVENYESWPFISAPMAK